MSKIMISASLQHTTLNLSGSIIIRSACLSVPRAKLTLLDCSSEVSLVIVVDPHDGGAGPDNAVSTEAQIRVGRDAANNYDDPARSEEREAGLDDGADATDLHHRVVLEVGQDGLLGSKLDGLLPPGWYWITDVNLESVLFEESTAVESQEAGTKYQNPLLSSPPGEAVLEGRGPGSHHGGEGAVDWGGEGGVQGGGEGDHSRALPQ